MEIGKLIAGLVFLAFGGINVFKPEIYIKYQKWLFKTFYKATFTPSVKTIRINKFIGIVFILIGLLVLIN